jgi:hypothetical protein
MPSGLRVADDVTDEDGMRFRDMRRTAMYYVQGALVQAALPASTQQQEHQEYS